MRTTRIGNSHTGQVDRDNRSCIRRYIERATSWHSTRRPPAPLLRRSGFAAAPQTGNCSNRGKGFHRCLTLLLLGVHSAPESPLPALPLAAWKFVFPAWSELGTCWAERPLLVGDGNRVRDERRIIGAFWRLSDTSPLFETRSHRLVDSLPIHFIHTAAVHFDLRERGFGMRSSLGTGTGRSDTRNAKPSAPLRMQGVRFVGSPNATVRRQRLSRVETFLVTSRATSPKSHSPRTTTRRPASWPPARIRTK